MCIFRKHVTCVMCFDVCYIKQVLYKSILFDIIDKRIYNKQCKI